MGRLIRQRQWSHTPLNTPDTWPPALRIALGILLHSPFPMLLFWDKELTCFYNDAFRPSLGKEGKHPLILGQSGKEAWPEIWDVIHPLISQVVSGGEASLFEDRLVPIYRNGNLENVYWTFSYSPVKDEEGATKGVLVVCKETTRTVGRFFNVVEQSKAPIAIFKGKDLVVDEANQAALALWRVDRQALGKPLLETVPGLRHHDFVTQLLEVYRCGQPYENKEAPLVFRPDELTEPVFLQFAYIPFREASGDVSDVMVMATDVTQQVLARQHLQALQASERRFRSTFENAAVGVAHIGLDGSWIFFNNKIGDIVGYSREELRGMTFQDITHPDDLDKDLRLVQKLLAGKIDTYAIEKRYRCKNGLPVWVHLTVSLSRHEDGSPNHFISIIQEISERKKTEEDLAYQKTLLETVTDNTDMALFLMDDKQVCVYMNEAAEQMTGFRLEELKGKQLHYYIHHTHADGKHYPLEECPIDQALPTQMRTKGEEVFVHRDGSFYPVAFTASPIVVEGNPVGTVIEVRDTTEEKKREQALKESEERFRSIANDTPAFIFMANADTHIDFLNKQWLEFIGQGIDEAKGKGWADITHPDDVPPMLEVYNRAVVTHQPYRFEIRQRAKDGHYHFVSWRGIPRIGPDGEFKGMLGVGIDVTENRKAVDALRQSEDLFRTFSNNIANLAWIANGEGWISWYNQRWYDYTGTTLEEMQGWGWEKVHHPDHIDNVMAFVKQAWTRNEPWELTIPLRSASGDYRWFLTRAEPIADENGKIYRWIGTNTDVHEQVNAQEELRLAKEQLELTFQHVPSAIYLFDKTGKFLYINEKGATQLGYASVVEMMQEKDIFTVHKRLATTYEIIDENGEAIYNNGFSPLQTLRNQAPSDVLSKRLHKQTGEVTWLWSKSTPLFDGQGELLMVLTTSTDVTAQQTFTEKLEREVQQRTRELQASNQDLQQFAHVASHDLKEPVRKIRTFAGRLHADKTSTLSENGQLFLSKIERSAQRMYDMIEGVLTYSTLNATQEAPREIKLQEIVQHIESDLEVVMQQKGATLHYTNLPGIEGAPVLIHQLFYNLVNNSLKFARPGVPPRIGISAEVVQREGKPFVQIWVKDNGIGFDQEHADRIFETFARLNAKDQYEGTGLGLSLCKKIVERHGGAISATGKPGEGTEIMVELPRKQGG